MDDKLKQLSDKNSKTRFLDKKFLFIIIVLVTLLAAFLYLKNYRIRYCQTKYSTSTSFSRSFRVKCLNESLHKFIFDF